MLENVRADLLRNCRPGERWQDVAWRWRDVLRVLFDRPGAWAVAEFRLRHWLTGRPRAVRLLLMPATFVSRHLIEIVTGISIHANARLGPGLYVGHFGAVVIGGGVCAGENLTVSQGVTIGEHRGSPTLGAQVYVGPGAKVFGAIAVGDHVAIGANAVVQRDVPLGCTVVTAEARVIAGRGNMMASTRALFPGLGSDESD